MTSAEIGAALDYLRRGWAIVPIPRGQKKPAMTGWPRFVAAIDDVPQLFGNGENIAVRLGRASGELVDLDLDCSEAPALADLYLPKTGAKFGRASKPRSHRLYIARSAIFESFCDPISGEMLLELRADGRDRGAHLSLLPPSVTDGERREWYGGIIAPAVVDARVLRRRAALLAMACLCWHYVSEHAARHPAPDLDLPRLLWEFDHALGRAAYRWLDQSDPGAPQQYPRPRRELTQHDLDLAEIVHAIPNNCSWDDWNRIGMAIYAASGGSGDGLIIFDSFSARSSKYEPRTVEERWRNYCRSPPSRIGLGSLAHRAREAGWRPPRKETSK